VLALRELQTRFANALFEGAVDSVLSEILAAGMNAPERIDIYRNNLREGFIKALAIGFPVIERLVGTDYFRSLALEYFGAHPSRSGNLDHIGAAFATFLRTRFESTQYEYLPDVAELEWAHHQALIAPDATPVTPDAFRDIPPENLEQLELALHPACALVRSRYPVLRIWRANQSDTADEGLIDLSAGGDDLLVLRTPACVEIRRVRPGEFAVLAAFSHGSSLGAALEAGQAVDAAFDIAATLRRLLALPILVGRHRPDAPILRISQ
jgi:uncharacterized protein